MDYSRQTGIFNPEQYKGARVTVIGAGSVGSFLVLSLAKMGLANITVYDHDKIEEHNLPNQFYRAEDVGEFKVEALADIVWKFAGVRLNVHPEKYQAQELKGIVIVATDSMDSRKAIWLQVRRQPLVDLLADIRVGGEVALIFAIKPTLDRAFYEDSLYSSAEAFRAPCGQQAIIYTVLGTACYASSLLRKHLVGERYPKEQTLDFKLNMIL
jgi:molybdopterin/thiamine biosynthesis adenylyltransferase